MDQLDHVPLPKCEIRYGPRLAQHRQKIAEDRLPISCRCWNDNSGMHLVANAGPNSGRQHLFSAQQWANAVPNFGFLTSRMVCRGKSDTWHLTDANSDTGPITMADSWLPRLGQYCAVLSPSAICTWVVFAITVCKLISKLITKTDFSYQRDILGSIVHVSLVPKIHFSCYFFNNFTYCNCNYWRHVIQLIHDF